MKKIPSLFKRDYEGTRLVFDEVVPGSEWVQRGEGIATQKHDGTACMVKDNLLYKRYDAKEGKPAPVNGIPCEDAPDPNTGHWPHWVPITGSKEDQYFREGWDNYQRENTLGFRVADGTYELVGPKVNGNREGHSYHILIRHGSTVLHGVPTEFEALKGWLSELNIEGIVWHHPDGRMVKIKRKDFGLKWSN